jgi:phytoene desaturase
MYTIVTALEKLMNEVGVQVFKNSQVTEIIISSYQAKGINANGFGHLSNYVISNLDVVNTYKKLLRRSDMAPEKTTKTAEKSTSAVIFYWGVQGKYKNLDVHNILFSKDYEKEFKYLFDYKGVYYDPTVYIYISSKNNSGDAPEGCENWFVMINVPHNKGQDWDKIIEEARENILEKIENVLKINLRKKIIFEETIDPRSIEQRTGSYLGALYGDSSNDRMAAFSRHANESEKIKGLYFCGGSVHPGGGIPLCLNSAKIVANLIPNAR